MTDIISEYNNVRSFDSINIYYVKDIPENPKAIIIIVHGLGEHLEYYNYTKDKLVEYGYGVYRFDNRGHGKSDGERGYVKSFKYFAKDTDKIVELVKKENNNLPIFMIGHSMGGFITILYEIMFSGKLNGQILSAAISDRPYQAKGIRAELLRIIGLTFPKTQIQNPMYQSIKKKNTDYDDSLILKKLKLKLCIQLFVSGLNYISKKLIKYTCPCFILHGTKDKMISKEASNKFYSSISSNDKEIKIYEGLGHELLKSRNKDTIIEDIDNWIKNRIN